MTHDSTIARIGKALSDPGRVRILEALRHGPLCACQFAELLSLAPATISKHVDVLKRAGLVVTEKRGRWVYCSRRRTADVVGFYRWFDGEAERDQDATIHARDLRRVLREKPEELCRRQRNRK